MTSSTAPGSAAISTEDWVRSAMARRLPVPRGHRVEVSHVVHPPKEPTVHEKSTPLVLPETTQGSLADVLARWASAEPGHVAFSVRSGAGWTDVTSATFAADVASVAKGRARLAGLQHVWVIDQGDVDSLSRDGDDVDDADLDARRAALDRQSLATIIYTSGTTGRPKG